MIRFQEDLDRFLRALVSFGYRTEHKRYGQGIRSNKILRTGSVFSDRIGFGQFTQRIGSTGRSGQGRVFSDRIGPGSLFKGYEKK